MLPLLFLMLSAWPQFLGPERNGAAPAEAVSLGNVRMLWKKQVGAGFSSPVVSEGKLILHHRLENREVVEAMDAATGKRVWAFEYPTGYRDDFGFDEGPRGTPTISGGRVFTFGAEGKLYALDFRTGKEIWHVDTRAAFGAPKGYFGAAASPLVEGSAVYVNVGGPKGAGLVAFDGATGKTLWTATNDEAGYSSPIAATVHGRRTILCLTREGLVGADPATGKVRFQFRWRSRNQASVNAAVPHVAGDTVFLTASYGTGAVLLDVSGAEPKKIWSSDDALSSHYASTVYKDGFLYGFHGRQEYGQALRCIERKTGKVMWDVEGFGAGTVTLAGDKLLIVRENGEAVLAPATPAGFQPSSRAPLLEGVVRSYPALADGQIFVRNEKVLAAFRVR